MNIQELIAKLQEYPPDTRVIVNSYKDGFNDIPFVGVNTDYTYIKIKVEKNFVSL